MFGWVTPVIPTLGQYDIWHVSKSKDYPRIGTPWPSKKGSFHSSDLATQEGEPSVLRRWLSTLGCDSSNSFWEWVQMAFLHKSSHTRISISTLFSFIWPLNQVLHASIKYATDDDQKQFWKSTTSNEKKERPKWVLCQNVISN